MGPPLAGREVPADGMGELTVDEGEGRLPECTDVGQVLLEQSVCGALVVQGPPQTLGKIHLSNAVSALAHGRLQNGHVPAPVPHVPLDGPLIRRRQVDGGRNGEPALGRPEQVGLAQIPPEGHGWIQKLPSHGLQIADPTKEPLWIRMVVPAAERQDHVSRCEGLHRGIRPDPMTGPNTLGLKSSEQRLQARGRIGVFPAGGDQDNGGRRPHDLRCPTQWSSPMMEIGTPPVRMSTAFSILRPKDECAQLSVA